MAHMNDIPKPHTFVSQVDPLLAPKIRKDLESQDFEITTPPYTLFSAKKKGINCTLYESGKLVVQGKDKDAFIEYYLEPEVLKEFTYTYQDLNLDLTPRIGIDESGKGDLFGPLCIAGVYADGDKIVYLKKIGVKDSKAMSDAAIHVMAKKIRAECTYHVVKINPLKYNELYPRFNNLNKLLAWGHATTIEALVEKTKCRNVIIDQFANEHVVKTALARKTLKVELTQRHRAEEDLVVAAASILARDAFVQGLKMLGDEISMVLPKGGSKNATEAGRLILAKHGKEGLERTAKLHFKNLDAIL